MPDRPLANRGYGGSHGHFAAEGGSYALPLTPYHASYDEQAEGKSGDEE